MDSIAKLEQKAVLAEKATKKIFRRLSMNPPRNLDLITGNLHITVFGEINCLDCANCCRNLGPRFSDIDIARLSKVLKMRPANFTDKYLKVDEDGDYVFRDMPCPFLRVDNRCHIYEHRPKACREYPHTDQRKFHQVLNLTIKNTYVCPAVYEIVERLKKHYH